jgi:hypothetical protein
MSDPFTDLGLDDRTRVIAPDPTAEYIPKLQVDELILGGYRIFTGQGTRAANGKLTIKGRNGNSCEVKLMPADDCQTKGIMAQVEWVGKFFKDSFKRFSIGARYDGDGELVTVDSTAHESTYAMPVYMPAMGAKSRSDGTDVPNTEHLTFSYFENGTHEVHIQNDTIRVELESFIIAFLTNDRSKIKARKRVYDTPTSYHWEAVVI